MSFPVPASPVTVFAACGRSPTGLKNTPVHNAVAKKTAGNGKLIVSVLGAINAYEREINEERREFGFRNACKEGRVGRPKAQASDTFYDAVKEWRKGSITATEAIARAEMPRATFYRLVKAEGL